MTKNMNPYIATPQSRYCYGEKIRSYYGEVIDSNNLLNAEGTTVLRYSKGGEQPKVILDMGGSTPGGYPFFRVRSYQGQPKFRISYADCYDYIANESTGKIGDFVRGCCKYLGVELPVLPANPNRFECYTINRTGDFFYPLIQGQQRFIMLTLETPGTELELEAFFIYYTSDMSETTGDFFCEDEKLNKLWAASTYTVQIASIKNSQAWEVVNQKLAIRALSKGKDSGIYQLGSEWKDYTFDFTTQISVNPHCSSGIGWMVRAAENDGYLFRLTLDGRLRRYLRCGGIDSEVCPSVTLQNPLQDNMPVAVRTEVYGSRIKVYINGDCVLDWEDNTYSSGSVGFCQTPEHWAYVEHISVLDQDKAILLEDDLTSFTECCDYSRSLPFIADGGKRDRLPWSGDLYWSGENAYYGFGSYHGYMADTLRMIASHQTPEGYMWATCYPEDVRIPQSKEYGYYESDIFSAWFVPVLADYIRFTDDRTVCEELYTKMLKNLHYLSQYIEADGLFYQRYETSKGLWDHVLNDFGKYSYNNLIMLMAFRAGEYLAHYMGNMDDAERFSSISKQLETAIMKHLWNEEKGYFMRSVCEDVFCDMANSLAMELHLVSEKNARRIVENMKQYLEHNFCSGKILILFAGGCFQYHLDEAAIGIIRNKNGTIAGTNMTVNWMDFLNDDNVPFTTTECMNYPPQPQEAGRAWGDRSHPDTGMAHLLSRYLLGVYPLKEGFRKFAVEPHPCELKKVEGRVSTPYGDIEMHWEIKDHIMKVQICCPKGTEPEVCIPEKYRGRAEVNIKTKAAGNEMGIA